MSYKIDDSIRAKHYSNVSRTPNSIKYIVVHYTGNGGTTATARANANYFKNTDRKASAHYIVDSKDVVYRSVPDAYPAYAVGDNQKYTNGGASMKGIIKNANSISIEMVSHSNEKGYYVTEQTMATTIGLIKDLQKKYNISDDSVYRHYDVTGKLCPQPLVDDVAWKVFKERLKEVDEVRYNKVNEMPLYARDTIQKLIDKGVIKGDEKGDLDLSLDMIRMLIFNDRAKLYK